PFPVTGAAVVLLHGVRERRPGGGEHPECSPMTTVGVDRSGVVRPIAVEVTDDELSVQPPETTPVGAVPPHRRSGEACVIRQEDPQLRVIGPIVVEGSDVVLPVAVEIAAEATIEHRVLTEARVHRTRLRHGYFART